jgi:hypothetical protein
MGPGDALSAEDAQLCRTRLNSLVDAWVLETLLAYATIETVFTLPGNTTSRTIGTGQQINVSRPIRIEDQSFVRVSGIDFPLKPITELEYNSIGLKSLSLGVVPSVCFFDGNFPTANVFFYPPTTAATEVHLVTLAKLSSFADLTTDYGLPPGYQRALEFNLAIEIAPDFEQVPTPMIFSMASTTKRLAKRANMMIPQLECDYPSEGGSSLQAILSGQ